MAEQSITFTLEDTRQNLRDALKQLSHDKSDRALADENSYYRSRAFSSKIGVNPIVTSASSILALLNKLKSSRTFPPADILHDYLAHEIKAFDAGLQDKNYSSETILLSCYILCGALDETLAQTQWGQSGKWDKEKLLPVFQTNPKDPNRFYEILDRLSADPAQHLDMLELMYLCLSLGFEGEYAESEQKATLIEIRDNLYHLIREQRGDFSKALLLAPKKNDSSKVVKNKRVSTRLALVLSLGLIITLVTGFTYILEGSASLISTELTHILLGSFD